MALAVVRRRRGWMVATAVLGWCVPADATAPTWAETVRSGPVSATLTTTYFDQGDGMLRADDLELVVAHADGGPPGRWKGPAFGPWGPQEAIVARAGAVRLVDVTGDGEAEALVDIYTGGAHCCAVSYLVWRAARPARYRMSGVRWGNIAPTVTDLDGDGTREFAGVDDRFAYAFGPYAVAEFPLRVWSLGRGGLTVTTARYRVAALAAMRQSWAALLEHRRRSDPSVGALAAYLANASNVGGASLAGAWARARRIPGVGGPSTLRTIERRLHVWGYRTR